MREYNKVGLIGLGVMGYGMAENLLKAGYTLIACDVNQERIKMLPMQEKVVAVDKPCDILKHTNTVITMLPNSPHVLEVLEGENGLLSGDLPEDFFMIDMSSISPDVTKEIGKKLEGMGIKFVDGPVSGGQSGAMNGTLTIMAGGKEEDVKEAMPIFEVVGKNIIHCGQSDQHVGSVYARDQGRGKSGDHDECNPGRLRPVLGGRRPYATYS